VAQAAPLTVSQVAEPGKATRKHASIAVPCEKPFARQTFHVDYGPSMPPSAPRPAAYRRAPIPTSFGGVASVAERSGAWLATWQWLLASLTGLVAVWTFHVAWARGLERAISNLPDEARILDGRLNWPDDRPAILHQGPFLAVVVDPSGLREYGLATDITLSIEADRLGVRSLLGWFALRYPPNLDLSLARLDATSKVSAWRSPFYFGLGIALAASLFAVWTGLSIVYGMVVWIAAAVLARPVPFRVARRLAGASLLPGCLLMIAAMILYATRQVSLVGFLITFPLHIVVGWVYCAGGWSRLQSSSSSPGDPRKNPFVTEPPAEDDPPARNPWQTDG